MRMLGGDGIVFVLVLLTLQEDTRQALMVTPLWFVMLTMGWLLRRRADATRAGNH